MLSLLFWTHPASFSIFLSRKWSLQKHVTAHAILARNRRRKTTWKHPSLEPQWHQFHFTVALGNKQWPPIRVSLSQSAYQILACVQRQRESKADRNGSQGDGRGGLTWSGISFLHLKASKHGEINVTEAGWCFEGTSGESITPSVTSLSDPGDFNHRVLEEVFGY